jgi:hypothetical protein
MSSPPPKKTTRTRKVGAPYGNHNALKHGFYSRHFRSAELSDLEAVDAEGLQDEIAAMRVYIRRFIASSGQGSAPGDPAIPDGAATPNSAAMAPYPDMLFLDAIGLAATRLACLLKTQKFLDRQYPKASEDLNHALAEVIKELGLRHDSKSG